LPEAVPLVDADGRMRAVGKRDGSTVLTRPDARHNNGIASSLAARSVSA